MAAFTGAACRVSTVAIVSLDVAAHFVLAELDGTGADSLVDSDPLRAGGSSCFRDVVVFDDEVPCGWQDIKPVSRLRIAVIQHTVVAKRVVVSSIDHLLMLNIDIV